MKTIKFALTAFFVISLLTGSASGQDGLALMKVETGARASGMGGAFVSIIGDPNSSAYNPASASHVKQFGASFGHNAYWNNIRIETGYFVTNFTGRTWWHGGVKFAAVDEIESRVGASSDPDALFEAHDISLKTGLAVSLTEKLTVGVAAGWYVEKIGEFRGSGFNTDMGVVYQVTPALTLGGSAMSLGSDISLSAPHQASTSDIALPATYRLGGSYKYDKYIGAADLVIVDDDAHLHLGAEGMLHERMTLRTGYMLGYDSKSFTAGASFVHRNFTVEYAFVPYSNNLGTTHLFNLSVTL